MSGLAHHGSNDDAIGVHTCEEERVLINNVNAETKRTCRSGLHIDAEGVGLRPVTVENETAADGNIEELFASCKVVEVHHAARTSRGRQRELAHKVLLGGA